jgi:AcrR family transcriptional regulator
MATSPPRDRERNAARTREQILDAAERLFAEQGFEETSLTEVGKAAGVSRATPGYFFGSKADLHRAVLERCFEEIRSAVRQGRERTLRSGQPAEVVLAGAVSDYFDFVAERPTFVKLIEREALSGRGTVAEVPLGLVVGREMIAALSQELDFDPSEQSDAAHLLFSLIALTWSPYIHGDTLARMVGLDADDPDFFETRKQHVTELLLGWLRARRAALAR